VPVPASVFDDDFFLRPRRTEDSTHPAEEPILRTDVRVPSFSGNAPAEPQEEHDELDIPAFLRRGSL
jgi:cell division protein FtsZ